jgi:hypothetical protein
MQVDPPDKGVDEQVSKKQKKDQQKQQKGKEEKRPDKSKDQTPKKAGPKKEEDGDYIPWMAVAEVFFSCHCFRPLFYYKSYG